MHDITKKNKNLKDLSMRYLLNADIFSNDWQKQIFNKIPKENSKDLISRELTEKEASEIIEKIDIKDIEDKILEKLIFTVQKNILLEEQINTNVNILPRWIIRTQNSSKATAKQKFVDCKV